MNEHQNSQDELSRLYREGEQVEPSQAMDDVILAAARDAAGARPQGLSKQGFANRWRLPFALAATVVLSVAVTTMVREEQSLDEVAFPAPSSDAMAERKVAEAASEPAKSPPHFSDTEPIAKPAYEPAPVARENRQADTGSAASLALRADKAEQAALPAQDIRGEVAADAAMASSSRAKAAEEAAPAAAFAPMHTPAPAMSASRALEKRDSSSRLQAESAGGASALANKPPEEWIDEIRALKRANHAAEAAEKLADFRKRFPSYTLPDDLK